MHYAHVWDALSHMQKVLGFHSCFWCCKTALLYKQFTGTSQNAINVSYYKEISTYCDSFFSKATNDTCLQVAQDCGCNRCEEWWVESEISSFQWCKERLSLIARKNETWVHTLDTHTQFHANHSSSLLKSSHNPAAIWLEFCWRNAHNF